MLVNPIGIGLFTAVMMSAIYWRRKAKDAPGEVDREAFRADLHRVMVVLSVLALVSLAVYLLAL
jgi:hypothetical protein